MEALMPSPVGHVVAGVAVAWTVEPRAHKRLVLAAAGLAAAPDLDLLLATVLPIQHRTITHSVAAVAVTTILAIVVTRQVNSPARLRIPAICGLAVASHLLLDWLGVDRVPPYGLQTLWPLSSQFYLSGLDWFRGTARINVFSHAALITNALAIAQEIAILGTIAAVVYLVRVKPATRFAPEMSCGHHSAQ